MKAKLKGKITKMTRASDGGAARPSIEDRGGEWISIELDLAGEVTDGGRSDGPVAPGLQAKPAGMAMVLRVKPLIGEGLRFGQTLYVEVTTEE